MSQIYLSATASTPSIPTSFVTDSGTAVPVANVLNLLGDDTTDNDTDGLRVIGSGSTATVQLTNRFYGTAITVGAASGNIISFDLGGSSMGYRFFFDVIARNTATNDTSAYTVTATFKTDGATATVINIPFVDADEAATLTGADVTMAASGNNALLQVTGVAALTINWAAVGRYIQI